MKLLFQVLPELEQEIEIPSPDGLEPETRNYIPVSEIRSGIVFGQIQIPYRVLKILFWLCPKSGS